MSDRRGRRACLATLGNALAAASLPGWYGVPAAAREAVDAAAAALITEAEAALADGRADAALMLFERASSQGHVAAAEAGVVRTMMQQGQYRRAAAFAAHVAGVHGDHPEGVALYAWLLWLGAQPAIARQVLARARARAPDDPVLADTDALLFRTGVLAERFWSGAARLLPYEARTPALPPDVEVIGTGCVVGERRVLAHIAEDDRLARVWVRDGLGRVAAARVEARADRLGVGALQLLEPLAAAVPLRAAPRDAFPGSPAWSAAFPVFTALPGALPAWPLLRAGFLGMRADHALHFGLDCEDAGRMTPGGAVFDSAGRFIGVGVGRHPARGMVQVAALRQAGLVPSEVVPQHASAPIAVDAIYEMALARTVQVIV